MQQIDENSYRFWGFLDKNKRFCCVFGIEKKKNYFLKIFLKIFLKPWCSHLKTPKIAAIFFFGLKFADFSGKKGGRNFENMHAHPFWHACGWRRLFF